MPALLINNEIYGNTPDDKQQEIISVINQASKSWMMTNDIEIAYQGIGAPSISAESGSYYLDVVTGNVYLGGTEWTLDRTLTSVQDELATINSNLAWKHLGNVKGSAVLSLSDEYNELYIECAIGGGGGTVGFQIPKIALSDTAKAYSGGRYDSASSYVSVAIALSKSEVYLSTCLNGSSNGTIDYLDTSILKVYYR